MVLSEHDITLAGTWCYPVTDWPRIIDLIARGRLPGREGGHRPGADGRRRRAGLRDAALADRRPGQGARRRAQEGRDEGAAVRRARTAPRSPSCRCPRSPPTRCSSPRASVGVCHSDIDLLEGRYIIPFSYPLIPGHEWSGEVVAVGRSVTGLRAGRPGGGGVRDRRRPLRLLDQRRGRGVLRRQARVAAPAAGRAVLDDGRARRAVQRRLLRAACGPAASTPATPSSCSAPGPIGLAVTAAVARDGRADRRRRALAPSAGRRRWQLGAAARRADPSEADELLARAHRRPRAPTSWSRPAGAPR